jgi:hypothetical protein
MGFIRLNRPDAKNTVDPAMHDELCLIRRAFDETSTVERA